VDYAFAEDATAVQTNPAGLGFVNDRIDWDAAGIVELANFTNALGRATNSPSWTVLPVYQLGVVLDPGAPIHLGEFADDKWGLTDTRKADDYGGPFHLAFGFFTDQGASFNWPHIETPFFAPAAVQYRGQEENFLIAAAFSFRITDWLSVGYAPAFRYSAITIDGPIQQPNTELTSSFQAVIPQVMTYAQTHNLDSYGFSQRLGIKLKTEYFSAGVVYRDRTYSSDYKGQIVQDATAGINKLPAVVQAALIQALNPALGFSSKYDARVEKFEAPREVGAGINVSPVGRVSLGLDFTYIFWSEFRRALQVRISHPRNPNFVILSGPVSHVHIPLEWTDQPVVAVGAQVTVLQGDDIVAGFPSYKLILRAGYNWGQSPLPRNTLNPALPLILEHHMTAGFTIAIGPFIEISAVGFHGFSSVDFTGTNHANSDLSGSRTENKDWAVLSQLSLKF
jgi:long-subunit fatty acid transport protein